MTRRLALLACLLLNACGLPSADLATPTPFIFTTVTPTPFQPGEGDQSPTGLPPQPPETSVPPLVPTPMNLPPTGALWLEGGIPSGLRDQAAGWGVPTATAAESATIRLARTAGNESPSTVWVFALVAAFPTAMDGVSSADLRALWGGDYPGALEGRRLGMSAETLAVFSSLWGPPAATRVSVWDSNLPDMLWADRYLLGLIEFGDLQPRLKVLKVDGQSPLHNDFKLSDYPLQASFTRTCVAECPALPTSNRDPGKLTVLSMTGVTALVRATAHKMEMKGVLYPGGDVRDLLRAADIAHVSNEIPFASDCPFPDPNQKDLFFCSDPDYIALLEDVGADVIELTGNHFQDWGSDATLLTLDMYDARGWPHFGGGRDLYDAMQPALIEQNGNRLAFIGCNPFGPYFAWATENQPGAAPCGNYTWLIVEIARLRRDGWLPIVTLQYNEYYYAQPGPIQQADFRALAEAGAVIVSGSQSHFPQSMEFSGPTFIHYGLGNLFFDQMDVPVEGTRRAFIDRYAFYDNRLIGIELITTMLEDYARPRLMQPWEREQFLWEYFAHSGW